MKRRAFIAGLGGAAAWPVVARGQTPRRIGFLHTASQDAFPEQMAAFRDGLRQSGFIEGQNVLIDARWADNDLSRLPVLAADLAEKKLNVIATGGGVATAFAAKQASPATPIVFAVGNDPVEAGLVQSLNHPGGTITGVTFLTDQLEAKRLGLLHELVPGGTSFGALVQTQFQTAAAQGNDFQDGAQRLGVRPIVLAVTTDDQIAAAFAALNQDQANGLVVCATPYFNSRRKKITDLAAQHKLPAIYEAREFALAGGLMSYGTSIPDAYRQVGEYVAEILKGAKPADLPVQQVTRFEFVINLKAAKALGLDVPPALAARADEVIE